MVQDTLADKLTERKVATIMFIDMVDSLGTIRDLDPEDARELFSAALAVMSDAIHTYGGVVASTLGDGVMALFGAPAAQEDHATRACLAALRLQEQLSQTSADRPAIRTRVGIHSGIVAISGSADTFEATGAVVHIAARLQNFAPPGNAILTAKTRALLARDIATEFMGSITVKGLQEPIDAFVVVGTQPASIPDFDLPGKDLLGRVSELRALRAAFYSAAQGNGLLVRIVGEAGIGKTTLVEKFLSQRSPSAKILRSGVERYGSTVPFQPFRDLIMHLFEIESVNHSQKVNFIMRRLGIIGVSDSKYIDALCDLCDLPLQTADWRELSPKQRRDAIIRAIIDVFLLHSEKHPLLICLEDIQWADSGTIELIQEFDHAVKHAKILIVFTYRSEFVYDWSGYVNLKTIKVKRLNESETRRLVGRLLGGVADTPLGNAVLKRCDGNPLFAHELIRGLVDSGVLGGPPNRRILLKDTASVPAPLSVTGIIAERIDNLRADLKEALLAASVLGEQFSAEVLARIAQTPLDEIRRRLQLLEEGGFLRSEKAGAVHAFTHGLFQEVAYTTLVRRRRQTLHGAAFQALKSVSSADRSTERLAYHAFNGCVWDEGVKCCWEAGRRAAARWSNREAIAYFENALVALGRRGPKEESIAEAIDLRLELRLAHLPLLHLSKVGELLGEAHTLALQFGHRHQLAKIVGFMGAHAYLTRACTDCVNLSRQSLRLTGKADECIRIAPTIYLAQALYGLGKFRQVISTITRILPAIEKSGVAASSGLPGNALLMSLYWVAISKAELGAFEEAESFCSKMLSGPKPLQPFEYIYAQTALGFVLLVKGEYEAALGPSELALEAVDRTDTPFMIPVSASQVGLLLAKLGRHSDGLEMGRRAVRTAEEIGVRAGRSRWVARLAEAYFCAGEIEDALTQAEAAVSIAEEAGEPAYLCTALRLRGRIRAKSVGDFEQSRDDMARAKSIAQRLQLGPELAKCRYVLGEVELRARSPAAMREFAAAEHRFRRFGMARWAKLAREAQVHGILDTSPLSSRAV